MVAPGYVVAPPARSLSSQSSRPEIAYTDPMAGIAVAPPPSRSSDRIPPWLTQTRYGTPSRPATSPSAAVPETPWTARRPPAKQPGRTTPTRPRIPHPPPPDPHRAPAITTSPTDFSSIPTGATPKADPRGAGPGRSGSTEEAGDGRCTAATGEGSSAAQLLAGTGDPTVPACSAGGPD
jgi:hypothetical protein